MTTTTDDTGAQLLAAIIANPEEDTPRLMYADWLEENQEVRCPACSGSGRKVKTYTLPAPPETWCPRCEDTGTVRDERRQRRAELIRGQCAVADINRRLQSDEDCGQPGCCECDERRALAKRADELLAAHGAEWARVECPRECGGGTCPVCDGTGDTMAVPGDRGGTRNPQWSRGFVYSVECRMEEVGEEVECENCGGDGEFTRRNSDGPPGPCPECGGKWNSGPYLDRDDYWDRGTGRVFRPAPWLAAVCGAHPIERVVITDLEPYHANYVYRWSIADRDSSPRDYQRFVPPTWVGQPRLLYPAEGHPTADDARRALATAVADAVRGAGSPG